MLRKNKTIKTPRKFGARLLPLLLCPLLMIGACAGNKQPAEPIINSYGRSWRSEKALFLDEDAYLNALRARHPSGISGFSMKDADTLADAGAQLRKLLAYELPEESEGRPLTLLYTLGALSGFSSQMATREMMLRPENGMTERGLFTAVKGQDGRIFFTGRLIDMPLYETRAGRGGVKRIIDAAAAARGAEKATDADILKNRVQNDIGTANYGRPYVSSPFLPGLSVIDAVNNYWNAARNYIVTQNIPPLQWPSVFASALADVIGSRGTTLDPALSAVLAAEGMAAGAYIDPAQVHQARF